ncbi:hypothetical protein [Sandarakinorhabdus sp.]|uniref:hypothetical protein n=1 Tax=Sandarakinorhabdus sp. TaxID=1916663 RepID=UPI003F72651C
MRTVNLVMVAFGLASPAAAEGAPQVLKPKQVAAQTLSAMADCTVAKEPVLAAGWLAGREGAPPRRVQRAMTGCLGAGHSAAKVTSGTFVMKGVLAAAFLRHPDLVPASVTVAPLPEKPTEDFDVVIGMASCIAKGDAAGARRFIDSVPSQPDEQAAYSGIATLATKCVQPWPDVAINGPMLRAGLGIALFRAIVSAASRAG